MPFSTKHSLKHDSLNHFSLTIGRVGICVAKKTSGRGADSLCLR